jgi:predicted DNA-binding transcriptional regulator AlpA
LEIIMSDPARPHPEKTAQQLSLTLAIDPQTTAKVVELIRETIHSTLKQMIIEIPILSGARSAVQPDAPPAVAKQFRGTELKQSDKARAADLRTDLLMGKLPEDGGLLIDTKTLAKLLDVSPRHLIRLLDLKAVPEPIRLGRLIRWRIGEIVEWIEADCPPQRAWTYKRHESSKGKAK